MQRFRPVGNWRRSGPERRFKRDSIRDALQNPYYAGLIIYRKQFKKKGVRVQSGKRYRDPFSASQRAAEARKRRQGMNLTAEQSRDRAFLFPGKHLPLISLDLFERITALRGARGHNPRRAARAHRIYPLSGLLTCDRCRHTFRGNASNGDIRNYEDNGRVSGASNCPVRSFKADPVEEVVFDYVRQLRLPAGWGEQILRNVNQGAQWDQLRCQQAEVHARLRVAREDRRAGLLSVGEITRIQRAAERELEQLESRIQARNEHLADYLTDFGRLWKAATDAERKIILNCIFGAIYTRDGQITGCDIRDPFKPLLPESDDALLG